MSQPSIADLWALYFGGTTDAAYAALKAYADAGIDVLDVLAVASGTDTAEIVDGAVTLAKLASNSVDSSKIVDGSIVNADINASAAIAVSKVSGALASANNLSDVTAATARTNLSVPLARSRKVGKWCSIPNGIAATGMSLVNGTVRYVPFDVEVSHSIDRIGYSISAAAGTASRNVTDMVTNGTTTITSATVSFVAGDVGKLITAGGDIPAGSYVASVTNSTTALMNQAATGSNTGQSLTLGATLVRFGIYNDNSGYPGSLLVDFGTLSVGAAGASSVALTVSRALTPGRYWAAIVPQGGAQTAWQISGNNNDQFCAQQSQGQVFNISFSQASIWSSLPDPAVTTTDVAQAPLVQFRVA